MIEQSFEEFKKTVNEKRKAGGKHGKWYVHVSIVDGEYVEIRGFKTWLQVFQINGINYPSCIGISVSQFNDNLSWVKVGK